MYKIDIDYLIFIDEYGGNIVIVIVKEKDILLKRIEGSKKER